VNGMEEAIEKYGALERRVQELLLLLTGDACRHCAGTCCRHDICEESAHSLFLRRVRQWFDQPRHLSNDCGWLDPDGCVLQYGRPPVCYEYFCDEILESRAARLDRWVLETAGRLVAFAGEQVLNGLHLVEIEHEADFEKIRPDRLLRRIQRATEALEAIECFIESGRFKPGQTDLLSTIHPLPDEL